MRVVQSTLCGRGAGDQLSEHVRLGMWVHSVLRGVQRTSKKRGPWAAAQRGRAWLLCPPSSGGKKGRAERIMDVQVAVWPDGQVEAWRDGRC